jgi:hypothetical protein
MSRPINQQSESFTVTIFRGLLVNIKPLVNEKHGNAGTINYINDNGRLFCVFTVHLTTPSI